MNYTEIKSANTTILHGIVIGTQICVNLSNVNKVLPISELSYLPGSPHYVVGLMNVKGKSIPVIDLGMRMGLERKEKYTIHTPILLCQHKNSMTGFIVDKILRLSQLNECTLQKNQEYTNTLILGTVIDNEETSLLINMDFLLTTEKQLIENSHDHITFG
jgi:purine-binding chemotaxis protein CheW